MMLQSEQQRQASQLPHPRQWTHLSLSKYHLKRQLLR
jgi:hypothetical protein